MFYITTSFHSTFRVLFHLIFHFFAISLYEDHRETLPRILRFGVYGEVRQGLGKTGWRALT